MNVSTDCVLVNEMLQDERDELYERLVLLRKRTGMSVREFAEFAGIPENTYRTYEAKNPRYRNHLKSYVIDLLEYKLTMEGKLAWNLMAIMLLTGWREYITCLQSAMSSARCGK